MSGGLIGGVVGGVAGFFVGGPAGAQIGFTIGSTVGALVDKPDGPSPGDLSAPQIQEGAQLVRPYGTVLLTVNPVSVSDYTATANDTGGKGGPPEGSAGYTYTLDVLGVIAQRVPSMPIVAITRVWVNKKLVQTFRADSTTASLEASGDTDAYTSITLYPGGSAQTPPPEYETRVGTANASAYRNVATVEIVGLNCGGSKTPPLVEVEVITSGTHGETGALTLLQSRFVAADPDDESAYQRGAPTQSGGTVSAGLYQIYVDFSATPSAPAYLRYDPAGLSPNGADAVTMEAIVVCRESPNTTGQRVIYFLPDVDSASTVFHSLRFGYGNATPVYENYGFGTEWIGSPSAGETIHFAVVLTASEQRAYVDGVLVWSGPGSVVPAANEMSITLGGESGPSTGVIDADVLGFRIRQEEVYTGAGFVPPSVIPPPDGGLDYWTPATVDLQDIVDAELSMNPAIVTADHDTTDLAGVPVRGFKAVGPPGKTIAELGDIFYFDCVPGNPIRYQLRGAPVVGTIQNDDTGVGVDESGQPFTGLKIGNDVERPSVIGLSAPNASADHEPVFRRGDRLTTEGPDVKKIRTEVELTPAEVQGRALAMTLMERASAHTAEYGLSDRYAAAEPGDAYYVYDDQGNLYNKFIRSLTYQDGVKECKWELNDTSALVETGITDDNYTPSLIVAAPVDSNLVAIDGPIVRDADDDPGFYTAIEGEGTEDYPGGIVRRSTDNLDFSEIATTHPTESVVGTATTALANWTGGYVWDEVSSVTVVVGDGQTLSSSTHAAMQADRNVNSAFIGVHGRWEVIRFRTATLGATATYTLTGLLRGMRGTEAHMGTHAVGDTFVLMTYAGLRRASGEVADIGQVRYLKAVTDGRPAASATSESFTNEAVGLLPFSPTNLRAERDGSGNITFSIDRRPRKFPRYGGTGGSYIPPADSGETYELDVYATSGYATVLRTLTSSTESFAYTSAQQVTDFGSNQATVYTRSYTRSAIVGRGHYLQASA